LFILLSAPLHAAPVDTYSGMSDASAAALLDEASAVVVADDEVNELNIYAADRPGPPQQKISLNPYLGINPEADKHPEVDLEAVARVGDRYYWISSHGRSDNGELRFNRHFFFAMKMTRHNGTYVAELVGRPYRNLAADLSVHPALRALDVPAALRLNKKKNKDLAPKENGFNIEGLSETRDGQTLLIALRNPRPRGKALLLPLRNPDAVVSDHSPPQFGAPILLDLTVPVGLDTEPLGIRSITYSAMHGCYLIIAGPHRASGPFGLFRWSGEAAEAPQLVHAATLEIAQVPRFNPEGLVVHQDGRMQLLSDDGALEVPVASPAECKKGAFRDGHCLAKELLDSRRRTFRGIVLKLD
jgi:hypothetical protein